MKVPGQRHIAGATLQGEQVTERVQFWKHAGPGGKSVLEVGCESKIILEAGCGGGFWRRILGCGLQRKVLEAGSGGVTMDGRPWHLTGARPEPGYPRGDRKADLKSCTGARASKTVNPIADVFGLAPRRPPSRCG